jgi:hypothetical protein
MALIDYGVCIGIDPTNTDLAIISNGYYQVRALVSTGQQAQIGLSYHVYKKGSSYFLGSQVNT